MQRLVDLSRNGIQNLEVANLGYIGGYSDRPINFAVKTIENKTGSGPVFQLDVVFDWLKSGFKDEIRVTMGTFRSSDLYYFCDTTFAKLDKVMWIAEYRAKNAMDVLFGHVFEETLNLFIEPIPGDLLRFRTWLPLSRNDEALRFEVERPYIEFKHIFYLTGKALEAKTG